MTEKKYNIGGKSYVQKPLVLGQLRQLLDVLRGVAIPVGAEVPEIVLALGDNLPEALAVILTESGKSPQDKDIPDLAGELAFTIPVDLTVEVIEDFFDCNPIASLLERFAGMTKKIEAAIRTGYPNSSSSSAAGISPVET